MCATVSELYNVLNNNYNNNCLFDVLICLQPFCKQQNLFGDFQTSIILFTQRVFTQDWLNYYHSSSSLSRVFIVLRRQSDIRSKSRMFVFPLSWELYLDFIAVCVLCTQTHCLWLRSLILRFHYLSLSYSCYLFL